VEGCVSTGSASVAGSVRSIWV